MSPIDPNPLVIIENLTSILLEWSPPFLWPGQVIKYYAIFVTNKSDDSLIKQERVTSSFDDVIVTLKVIIDEDQKQECNEVIIEISAVNNSDNQLQTFNRAVGYPSSELT